MLELKNITKTFGEKTIFNQFSFSANPCERVVITGRSGVGKTTLLRIIAGLEKVDSGEVVSPNKIAMVFQEERLLPFFTALDNVAQITGASHNTIAQHFKFLGLETFAHKKISELSGGMKRRVSIIRAVLFDAPLILLDEPFKGLDAKTQIETLHYLNHFTANKTMLMATHNVQELNILGSHKMLHL